MSRPDRTENDDFEAQHDPLAVSLAKAYHDAGSHYLPWPDSLRPCPDWIRHLSWMETVAADERVRAALEGAPDDPE